MLRRPSGEKTGAWRRNMEETAKPSAYARARFLQLQSILPIGRRMQWCGMTRKNFRLTTAAAFFIAFHGSWDRAPYAQGWLQRGLSGARR